MRMEELVILTTLDEGHPDLLVRVVTFRDGGHEGAGAYVTRIEGLRTGPSRWVVHGVRSIQEAAHATHMTGVRVAQIEIRRKRRNWLARTSDWMRRLWVG